MVTIDFTYFKAEIYIGQLGSVDVQTTLQIFIDKYTPDYLNKLLGVDYDYNVDKYEVNSNENIKNAIANYVFYFYQRSQYFQNAGTGMSIPENENSQVVKPTQRVVLAWNEMFALTRDFGRVKSIENPFSPINQLDL